MASSMIKARESLVTLINEALGDSDFAGFAECFNWRPAQYARSIAVIVENCTFNLDRQSFAGADSRRAFLEHATVAVSVETSGSEYDKGEAASHILQIIDIIQDLVADNYTLGGSDALVVIRAESVTLVESEDTYSVVGQLMLSMEFRIT